MALERNWERQSTHIELELFTYDQKINSQMDEFQRDRNNLVTILTISEKKFHDLAEKARTNSGSQNKTAEEFIQRILLQIESSQLTLKTLQNLTVQIENFPKLPEFDDESVSKGSIELLRDSKEIQEWISKSIKILEVKFKALNSFQFDEEINLNDLKILDMKISEIQSLVSLKDFQAT